MPEPLGTRSTASSPLDSWGGCFAYLARWCVGIGCGLTLLYWLTLKLTGDWWHWGTLLLYAPRWFGMIPWAVTTPLIFFVRPPQRVLFGFTGLVGAVSLIGFNLPLANFPVRQGESLRVITCNMQRDTISVPGMESLIEQTHADVVLLQEFQDRQQIQWPRGWSSYSDGGLTIGSRYPLVDFQIFNQDPGNPSSRTVGLFATVQTPARGIRVASFHFSTPRWGLSELLDRETGIDPRRFERLIQETELRSAESAWARAAVELQGDVDLIAGDFNTPIDSRIFVRDWWRFRNAFSEAGWGIGHTKFEEYQGWNITARIDHILLNPRHRARHCWVGPDIGSDHLPVIADIALH